MSWGSVVDSEPADELLEQLKSIKAKLEEIIETLENTKIPEDIEEPSDWDDEYSEAIEEGVEDAIMAWSDERAKRALLDTWYDEDEEEESDDDYDEYDEYDDEYGYSDYDDGYGDDDDCGLDCFENVLDYEARSWADMVEE